MSGLTVTGEGRSQPDALGCVGGEEAAVAVAALQKGDAAMPGLPHDDALIIYVAWPGGVLEGIEVGHAVGHSGKHEVGRLRRRVLVSADTGPRRNVNMHCVTVLISVETHC